jgi:hypothetical protein
MYIFHPIFLVVSIAVCGLVVFLPNPVGNVNVLSTTLCFTILIPDFYILCVMIGFPLLITIIRSIRRKAIKGNDLDMILQDEESRAHFRKYAESEFSVENVLCFDEIQKYKKSPSVDMATNINVTFLAARAPIEVNIQRKAANDILAKMKEGKIEVDLFDGIIKDLMLNMSDTFSRYSVTTEYAAQLRKKEMIAQI